MNISFRSIILLFFFFLKCGVHLAATDILNIHNICHCLTFKEAFVNNLEEIPTLRQLM